MFLTHRIPPVILLVQQTNKQRELSDWTSLQTMATDLNKVMHRSGYVRKIKTILPRPLTLTCPKGWENRVGAAHTYTVFIPLNTKSYLLILITCCQNSMIPAGIIEESCPTSVGSRRRRDTSILASSVRTGLSIVRGYRWSLFIVRV